MIKRKTKPEPSKKNNTQFVKATSKRGSRES